MVPQLSFERTPITLLLMATMVALEVLGQIDHASRHQYYVEALGIMPSSMYWGSISQWQPWRPFTTTLLHGGLLHAFFNIYILALFGATLEYWLKPQRMLALVLFLAFVSSLPQFFFTNFVMRAPHAYLTKIVGFSGVNYGFFGLLWIGRRYRMEFNYVCNPGTIQIMLGWFFLCILLTNLGMLPVANVAHGAGLIFGVLIALTVFRPRERLRWGALLGAASVSVLGIMAYPLLRFALAT